MSKFLMVSLYFSPDLSAGAFRTSSFVDALNQRADETTEYLLITGRPSRYRRFDVVWAPSELIGRVRVQRLWFPVFGQSMFAQGLCYSVFFLQALVAGVWFRPNAVWCTSSRLFTSLLGRMIASLSGARLIVDVRDLFADTIISLYGRTPLGRVMNIFSSLESFVYRRADLINVVSPGFTEYIRERGSRCAIAVYTNGIDDLFLTDNSTAAGRSWSNSVPGSVARVVYAGNVGDGQRLHQIIPELAALLADEAEFLVVGDGSRRNALTQACEDRKLKNFRYMGAVERSKIRDVYSEADVLFLHLGENDAFSRVIPSKIFEYGALGLPILAGVRGVARKFIEAEIPWARCFDPCDAFGAAEAYKALLDGLNIDSAELKRFRAKYFRRNIMMEYVDRVQEIQ
jgi:glycosyltransferase involved in cell wall biosynthesis